MKRLLVVSEKYNQSLMICKSLFEYGVIDEDTLIDSIHVMPMSWWHFKIPSHISMSSIPFSERPLFTDLSPNPNVVDTKDLSPARPGLLSRFDCTFCLQDDSIQLNDKREVLNRPDLALNSSLPGREGPIKLVADRIDEYDQIILSPDCDGPGVSSLFRWLDFLDHELSERKGALSVYSGPRDIRFLKLNGMDSGSVYQSYQNETPLDDPFISKLRVIGDAKRVFDYWWFYNSAAVFSKIQKHVGVRSTKIISKYELMTLHLLSNWGKPIDANNLMASMDSWLGTGKYEALHCFIPRKNAGFRAQCYKEAINSQSESESKDKVWGQIGTAMSRAKILENLVDMGLVNGSDSLKGEISLSEKGQEFLSCCHKATFDPDLPFRLSVWCANADYDKMARYIRTVFGKQKRYLSKLNVN